MIEFTLYYTDTGRIHCSGTSSDEMLDQDYSGQGLSLAAIASSPNTQYISNNMLLDRPVMNSILNNSEVPADGITTCIFSGVPEQAMAHIKTVEIGPIIGGTLELTFDEPGTYTVRLELFPYLDAEFTINAV